MLCGETVGDCGGNHVHIPKYHCGVELVPRVLVDDVNSFPVVWGEVLICRKISELHEKKVPTIKLEHASCTISPDCCYN